MSAPIDEDDDLPKSDNYYSWLGIHKDVGNSLTVFF